MAAIYGVVPNIPVEASYVTDPAPLMQHSWHFGSAERYADNVYLRSKLVLTAMERQTDEKTMTKILRTYFQKYRFRHPTTADFQKTAESVTKTKWNEFFRAYVYQGQMADFGVESIESQKNGVEGYRFVVSLRRYDGSSQPVPVLFGFDDGKTVRKMWDGGQKLVRLQLDSASPLSYVAVDPGLSVVLDNRRYNNFLKSEIPAKQRARWTTGVTQLVESLFGTLAW
jgi:aminopeptidase N